MKHFKQLPNNIITLSQSTHSTLQHYYFQYNNQYPKILPPKLQHLKNNRNFIFTTNHIANLQPQQQQICYHRQYNQK